MKKHFVQIVVSALCLGIVVLVLPATASAQSSIPPEITTPDKVETRIGTLEFFDGYPTDATVQKVYDNLDLLRGVEVFLNFCPSASIYAIKEGSAAAGAGEPNQILIFEDLMDSKSIYLTGNTDTVYALTFLDLKKYGPTVVEVPPNVLGTLNDMLFRYIVDMGRTGPDQSRGGRYLILPPDYDGPVPFMGFHVSRSPTYWAVLVLRGFLVDGSPKPAAENYRNHLRVYPFSKADNPPPTEFVNASGNAHNTVHANNFKFFEEVNAVVQYEPRDVFDPESLGLLASIGIIKGKPFEPDARKRKILEEAAAIGNATARAITFKSRDPRMRIYEDGNWMTAFVGGNYQFLTGDYRDLDTRTMFYYFATVNTPAMVLKIVGMGSQYAWTNVDSEGRYLDGGKIYRLNIPANPPAKDFWSLVIYDPQTRSMLQTDNPFPSLNSERNNPVANADGSYDTYFAPKVPKGKENNWIQTVPGKGWFVVLRLYGPLEPWFDQTWRPGEIELME